MDHLPGLLRSPAVQALVMMDNIEWQRFFRGLTRASSAQGVLTQKLCSLLDPVQRGGEMLEGTFWRAPATAQAHAELQLQLQLQSGLLRRAVGVAPATAMKGSSESSSRTSAVTWGAERWS